MRRMSESKFKELIAADWKAAFDDDGTGNWQDNWVVDGCRADIRNTPRGMVFAAGPVERDNGSHAVIWTKRNFAGDMRIELDFTRLDTIVRFVNIIYIQATGICEGPYTEDVLDWSHLRDVPMMSSYFNTMNTLHVSFAAFQGKPDEDYVRARRYPARPDRPFDETDIAPDNFNTGLFQPGVTYHFTFIKTGEDLFFEVKNDDVLKLFHWPIATVEAITHGRVGIRHMWTRCSRYANIRMWTK
jgi:hypothetical protein